MTGPMNDSEKKGRTDTLPMKAAGIVSEAVWNTPDSKMSQLTVLPVSITLQLSGLETVEAQWRDLFDHQIKKALILYKNDVVVKAKINKLVKDFKLPSEILRLSLYKHNRSIKGEHLEHGRETVEGEIATQNVEEEEPVKEQ